jgi:hypothetical protein
MATKYLTGYKMVREDHGQYFSCNTEVWYYAVVEYLPGKFVHPVPGCGPLAVFDSLAAAESLLYRMSHVGIVSYRIFSCSYRKSRDNFLYFSRNFPERVYELKLPWGTCFADAVKLVTEVHGN